ncbi:MAG: dienelactone hydrolase family protein [Chloroflexi bacterium]|nr:MAG: dienelactone hydrolase family protein [Chloroflexota bacterium]
MGEMVEFPSNGHTSAGYLATPSSGRGPGVIVIQEYWGLVEHIRDVCDRFAADGFVALAPDLYHGTTVSLREPDEAGKQLMALQLDVAAREMLGAARWLADSERTAGDEVGITGFCLGGALALHAASLSEVFGAVVPFYPYLPYFKATGQPQTDYTRIRGAVLGHFASNDGAYTKEQVQELETQLRDAGLIVELFWYEGADHAFFNDDRPEVYKPEAAQLAWDRTVAFFRTHLATTAAPV